MITLKEAVIVDFETKLSEISVDDYLFWIKKTVAEVVDQVPIAVAKMVKTVLKIPSQWLLFDHDCSRGFLIIDDCRYDRL